MRRREFLLAGLLVGCSPSSPRSTASPEHSMKTVTHDGVSLATQAFGSPGDPALVLVMGATASMLMWPEELCADLARRGLFVVRFDHRDTGASTKGPAGAPAYTVEDMGGDVLAIMDAYGLDRAHLAGMSLGAYIAQMLALSHADRIRSLTLIGAEPLGWDGPALPHISETFMAHFSQMESLDWSDEASVETFLLEIDRLSAGPAEPFDVDRAKRRIRADLERSSSPASMFNHSAVQPAGDWTGAWRRITQPVLVIHGEADPVLPLPNGQAIAQGVQNGSIIELKGVGHELPLSRIPEIAEAISDHVQAAEAGPSAASTGRVG